MTKPTIVIHNVSTGEIIEREMTTSEFTAYKAQQDADLKKEIEAKTKETQRQEILDRIGLTADELKTILG